MGEGEGKERLFWGIGTYRSLAYMKWRGNRLHLNKSKKVVVFVAQEMHMTAQRGFITQRSVWIHWKVINKEDEYTYI